MSKRGADVLVETLEAAGVKRCYGIVGDTLNQIARAINASEIEWVHMRHEEAGAFAAGAEAEFTGNRESSVGHDRNQQVFQLQSRRTRRRAAARHASDRCAESYVVRRDGESLGRLAADA